MSEPPCVSFGRSGGRRSLTPRVAAPGRMCHIDLVCSTSVAEPLVKTLTIREMRGALGRLDQIVAREGEILVTRRGRAVARLLPVPSTRPMPSHADLRARMGPLRVPSEVLVRQDRDRE